MLHSAKHFRVRALAHPALDDLPKSRAISGDNAGALSDAEAFMLVTLIFQQDAGL